MTTAPSSSRSPAAHARRLREAQERFIMLWGQMASSWGVPRSMAEVHALLYIRDEPLNTDDVMQALDVSRGNASMTLRALEDWGVVSRVHVRGDRKEYFRAEQDVWKLFRTILRERKRREIDPLIEALQECRELTTIERTGRTRRAGVPAELEAHNRRLDTMLEFIQLIDSISQRLINAPDKGLQLAAKLLKKSS